MPQRSANIELVHAAYQSFHARDVEALLATMSPDVEWVHPVGMNAYGLGGTKHGHAGVKEFLAHVPTVIGGMRLEPLEFISSGDRVVVFGIRHVTSLGGRTQTLEFVHSWSFRDGLVTRMEDIFDTVEFQRVIAS